MSGVSGWLHRSLPWLFALLPVGVVLGASADGSDQAGLARIGVDPSEVVVTATRAPQPSLRLPVSIERLDAARLREGQPQLSLAESLQTVAGVSAQDRQNFAQDLQMSVRGFGARSSFGVRGIRLFADGIPLTMPDGQGQVSSVDLRSADHIEVLRGPFSALYGNASGGVINIFSEEGAPGNRQELSAAGGNFGSHTLAAKFSGGSGGAGPSGGSAGEGTGPASYLVDLVHFATDGYRDHSAAMRDTFNSKLRWSFADGARLTVIGNAARLPQAQDPLGLTRAQLVDPTQAGTNSLAYNTRKSVSQAQLGAIYERESATGTAVTASAYLGRRATTQYQAILQTTEALSPTHPGGVIDLGRSFFGTDIHVSRLFGTSWAPLRLTGGVAFDRLDEARKGYLNFIGTELGVMGALRRNQNNRVDDVDEYLQAQWVLGAALELLAGVRHSQVSVSSDDHMSLATSNPHSSVGFAALNPVAGVSYRFGSLATLYASFGRGFETPTLNDLAYASINGNPPGLNLGLQAARSNNYEVGIKTAGPTRSAALSGFQIDTRNELAVLLNSGGRTVYQNIPATTRHGAELSFNQAWGRAWGAHLAVTWLDAEVAQAYSTCITLPCKLNPVAVGSRLPAVPGQSFFAALTWHAPGWGPATTLEVVDRARIFTNDLNTDAAAGYVLGNLRIGFAQHRGLWRYSEYLRADNFTNRQYIGSVIVNESNSRYFEPEPGRTFYMLLSLQHD